MTSPGPALWLRWLLPVIILVAGAGIGLGLGLVFGPPLLGAAIGSGVGAAIALSLTAWFHQRQIDAIGGNTARNCRASKAAMGLGRSISAWMALYVLLVVLISWIFDIQTWPYAWRAAAAITPAIPIGGVIVALMHYLTTEPDEFQRLLMTRAVLLAAGLTFFAATAWGFLEFYVHAPHFPTGLIMCVFWAAFGFTNPWVRWRNG